MLSKLFSAIANLWHTRDELNIHEIRIERLPYLLPLTLSLILLDLRNAYFTPGGQFSGSTEATIVYVSYVIGSLFVIFFCLKSLVVGVRLFAGLAAAGCLCWILLPDGTAETAALGIFQFGHGACTIYGMYAYVFVLNNAERLLGAFLTASCYGLFVFLQQVGIESAFLSAVLPGLMTAGILASILFFRKDAFPDTSKAAALTPTRGVYIILACPLAFFTIKVFGGTLLGTGDGLAYLRGIGAMVAVLISLILQFAMRKNIWYMVNLFLLFTIGGVALLAFPIGSGWNSLGDFLLGVGDGFGYIMTFYMTGMIKKYRSSVFFKQVTLATMGSLLISILLAAVALYYWPQAMVFITAGIAVFFLLFFLLFSPVLYHNVFFSDWIGDFQKSDMTEMSNTVEQVDQFDGIGLSPREKQIAILLLRGMTMRQVAAELSIAESTVTSYSKSLYRKLEINSRPELFIRFGMNQKGND